MNPKYVESPDAVRAGHWPRLLLCLMRNQPVFSKSLNFKMAHVADEAKMQQGESRVKSIQSKTNIAFNLAVMGS